MWWIVGFIVLVVLIVITKGKIIEILVDIWS